MRPPSPLCRAARALLLGAAAPLLLLSHCGGTTTKAQSASDADDESGEYADEAVGFASQCDDGTCFPCAENGICPIGYFCDESAAAGPACEWLPECPEEATCSCVLGVLGESCSCEERDGGVYVSC
jgi:hypothetical protein